MQVAPGYTRSRDPKNPIQDKAVISWAPSAARTALNHERLKIGPFLIAHQTTDQGSFLKSYLESEPTRFGNPLCQHALDELDWSACALDFKICIASLKENVDESCALLKRAAATGDITMADVREWPVFDWIRDDADFRATFKEAFGEDLSVSGDSERQDMANASENTSDVTLDRETKH